VFNVADSAIVVGVALLALNALSPTPTPESARAGDASD
jgi:lipoprotein signal peptidase